MTKPKQRRVQRHFKPNAAKRGFALFVDFTIFFVAATGICAVGFDVNPVLFAESGVPEAERLRSLHADLVSYSAMFLGWFLYGSIAESLRTPATFGKRLVGLRVYAANGGRLPVWRNFLRNFAKPVSMLPAMAGGVWAALSPSGRAWHDYLARGIVAERE